MKSVFADPVLTTAPKPSWNHVRERLDAGEFVIGLTVTINNLDIAVAAAQQGFHFLWVEMEHSPISLETLRGIVLATRSLVSPSSPESPSPRFGRPSACSTRASTAWCIRSFPTPNSPRWPRSRGAIH